MKNLQATIVQVSEMMVKFADFMIGDKITLSRHGCPRL